MEHRTNAQASVPPEHRQQRGGHGQDQHQPDDRPEPATVRLLGSPLTELTGDKVVVVERLVIRQVEA